MAGALPVPFLRGKVPVTSTQELQIQVQGEGMAVEAWEPLGLGCNVPAALSALYGPSAGEDIASLTVQVLHASHIKGKIPRNLKDIE